ncbi:sugar transferase [Nocardioides guangzhouensis]|uniref:sugar transferase n=1 Tax=Nocardioides guangzhouensis TaxID=2497878 RepID=UPI00143865C0|nr:sugar transferase [Nocardioides guangzhouensis]
MTLPGARRRRGDVALLAEIALVATVVVWTGWVTRGPSLTVAACLALVLVTLYHSGRQVTRQGLPHFGRVLRDMAIPIAAMASAAEFYARGRGVIGDSIQMVVAGTLAAAAATLARRHLSGRVRVLLIGDAEAIARTATTWAGSRRVAVVGAMLVGEDAEDDVELFGVPVERGLGRLRERAVDWDAEIAVALPGHDIDSDSLRRIAWSLEDTGTTLAVLSLLDTVAPHRIDTTQFAGSTILHIQPGHRSMFVRVVKGAIDRTVGTLALVVAAPVMLTLLAAVRIESRGKPLYKQTRIGRNGKPFTMYKIRSMCADADQQRSSLLALNERDGVLFKMESDPRVTRVGRFLRKSSLDELPQLWNVVRGDMSLIGPRPALPEEVKQYDEVALRRLAVKPGLTGLSQVNGRAALSYDSTIQLDVFYTDNWRLADDLAIGANTVRAVISAKGAY